MSFGNSTSYVYPTEVEREVISICNQVHAPQFAPILLETRKSSVTQIIIAEKGVVAFFRNGRQIVLPIASGLPLGKRYYCGPRVKHYPCLAEKSRDPNCTRNSPYRSY